MLNLAAHRKDRTVAFVAAIVLLLQALVGSIAMAAGPSEGTLDAFGNVLCITSGETSGSDADRNGHSSLPDCCTVACAMFAAATSGSEAGPALANPLRSSASLSWGSSLSVFHTPVEIRGSGSPRAPPRTV